MNKQVTHQAKVRKLERELGARVTGDPDGVLAVLQIARRLLAEGVDLVKDAWCEKQSRNKPTKYSVLGALRAAVDLAHPRDRHRALGAAQHALQGALNVDKSAPNGKAHLNFPVITRWESHPDTTMDDALRVVDLAIKNQGRVNIAASKAKGRK